MRVDSHLHHLHRFLSATWVPLVQRQAAAGRLETACFQTSLYPHIKCATQRLFLPQSICFGFSYEGAECCCMISPSNLPRSTSQHLQPVEVTHRNQKPWHGQQAISKYYS